MHLRRIIWAMVPIATFRLFFGGLASATLAAPRELVIKDLGTLDGISTHALALNDRGQVVGTAVKSPNEVRPFLWESGRMIDLGPGNFAAVDINNRGQILMDQVMANPNDPTSCFLRDGETMIDLGNLGGTQCRALDINNHGQVVGTVGKPPRNDGTVGGTIGEAHAFLWDSGTMINLGSLGGDWAEAYRTNDRGQIVGSSTESFGSPEHAFLWEAGVMTDLGTPGGNWSRAVAINNRGQVVLQSGDRVFLWEAGSTVELGGLGGDYSYALDINEQGQILLLSLPGLPSSPPHGAIWDSGTLTPLLGLGGDVAYASRLNDRGQAAGLDWTALGVSHAAIWTPAPSPGRPSR